MSSSFGLEFSGALPSLIVATDDTAFGENDEDSENDLTSMPSLPKPIPHFGFGPPLNKLKEAKYFMHYIQNLGSWFDTCDPERHFSIEVPKRAHHLPLLAYSILAYSARQLGLMTGIDKENHASYYSHALRILIPIFDDPSQALNENVLAAIVILRSYEEMFEGDVNTHLTGSSRLLNAESQFVARGGLGEAASWVVLRQDLYVCLTKSLPLRINLASYRQSRAFTETSDHSLANRAVFVCGQAVAYARGANPDLDVEKWQELDRNISKWYESTPWGVFPSDQPAAIEESDSAFPALWMPRKVQVLGYQHYYLSRIILEIFNPRIWKPSFEACKHREIAEGKARESLRILLGLTVSNPGDATVNFTTHHTLHTCGGLLKDEREQREVLGFLGNMTAIMGWPTQELANKLREQWQLGIEVVSPDN